MKQVETIFSPRQTYQNHQQPPQKLQISNFQSHFLVIESQWNLFMKIL